MSVKGAEELIARLEAMGKTNATLKVVQLAGVAEAKKDVHRQTGHLGRSIFPGRVTKNSATIEARTPYAAAEELGRRAVTIRPTQAKVLAWGGSRRLSGRLRSGSGPTHFAKEVRQPAREGHHRIIPAIRRAASELLDILVARWNAAA